MEIFQSDPKPLLEVQSEKLGNFFNSDTCKLLRKIARSRIAKSTVELVDNTTTNASANLQNAGFSNGAKEQLTSISENAIFLQVLDGIEAELKAKVLILTDTLTIDGE